jgi:hypothetical protein
MPCFPKLLAEAVEDDHAIKALRRPPIEGELRKMATPDGQRLALPSG